MKRSALAALVAIGLAAHAALAAPPAPPPAGAVRKVGSRSFKRVVLGSSVPVVLEFGAAWCGPCRRLEPRLEELALRHPQRLLVARVDIDASPYLAYRFGIDAVPTIVLFDGGKVVGRLSGLPSMATLESQLGLSAPPAAGEAVAARPGVPAPDRGVPAGGS